MATRDPKRVSDGTLSMEAGVNSGVTPNLVAANASAWAINATCRGGWWSPRPGFRKVSLDFGDATETDFTEALFQLGAPYQHGGGAGSIVAMTGGRVWRIELNNTDEFPITEISISGDLNSPVRRQAWWTQAEKYLVVQDGQSKPLIFNGGSCRRATTYEIPVGRQMAYYMGRIWIARGREYVAGDIVYGPSGTAAEGYLDAVLKMTENTYLSEGGAFSVPAQAGEIVALKPIANINTVLGQGELIVFTEHNVFSTLVPQDRVTWKTTQQPLQRMIQLSNGAFGQESVINVNEDLFYRSDDGVRSLVFAVRNSGQWGNTPVSQEVDRILQDDSPEFMPFVSGVNWRNWMLMLSSPQFKAGRGTYFRALCALDFSTISTMANKTPPAWEGIWTGLRFLKVLTVMHNRKLRCFAFVLNDSDQIELWELDPGQQYDYDGTTKTRIEWSVESRAMDFGSKFERKRLQSGDVFVDRISGEVDFNLDFRPDSHPCWIDWDDWDECSKTEWCSADFGTCPDLPNYKEQYRAKHQLTQPPDTFDTTTQQLYRVGFEFQTRINVTGFCRLKQQRYNAYEVQETPHGQQL